MPNNRSPNAFSPEEVRRAIARLNLNSTEYEADVAALEAADVVIDARVDVLEAIISDYSAETDDDVVAGQPVYVKADTHVGLAVNGGAATHQVAGLAVEAALATAAVEYRPDGKLQIADWTAITGAANLTPGAYYFLGAVAGTMTTVAPTVAGAYMVRIGRAITTKVLDIEVGPLILL